MYRHAYNIIYREWNYLMRSGQISVRPNTIFWQNTENRTICFFSSVPKFRNRTNIICQYYYYKYANTYSKFVTKRMPFSIYVVKSISHRFKTNSMQYLLFVARYTSIKINRKANTSYSQTRKFFYFSLKIRRTSCDHFHRYALFPFHNWFLFSFCFQLT